MEISQTENTQNSPVSGEAIEFGFIVSKLISDMKFVAWYCIIFGAIYCITILGAIMGVPLIIMGLRLKESAEELAIYKNSNDFTYLKRALDKQQRFFFIQKILMIISLVLMVLYIIFIAFFFTAFMSKMGNPYNYEAYSSILRSIF